MPFLASLNGSVTAMIDYDCSNFDVNLVFSSLALSMLNKTVKYELFLSNLHMKTIIMAITLFILLSIKELRVKLSSKMLVILCGTIILVVILKKLYLSTGPQYKVFLVCTLNLCSIFNMIWLLIISYDYFVVLWWDLLGSLKYFYLVLNVFRSEMPVINDKYRLLKYFTIGFVTSLIITSTHYFSYYLIGESGQFSFVFILLMLVSGVSALFFIVSLIVWRKRSRQISAGLQSNVTHDNQTRCLR